MKKLSYNEKRPGKTKKTQNRRRTVHGYVHNHMEPESMGFAFTTKTPLNIARHTRRPLQVVSASKTSSNYLFSASEPQTESKKQHMRTQDTKCIEPIVKSKSKLSFVSRRESGSTSPEENINNSKDIHLKVEKKGLNDVGLTVDCHASTTRKKSLDESPGHSLVSLRKSGKLNFVLKDTKKSCTPDLKEVRHKASSKETKPLNTPKTNITLLSNSNINNLQNSNKAADSSKLNSSNCIQTDSCMNKMTDIYDTINYAATYSTSTGESVSDDELSKSIFDVPSIEVNTESSKTPKDQTATKKERSKLKTSRRSVSISMRKALQEARISALRNGTKDSAEIEQKSPSKKSNNTVLSSAKVVKQKSSTSKSDKSSISLVPELENQSQFKPKSQETKDWMHLFEDPYPRRSPRLSSVPRQDPREYKELLDNLSSLTSRDNVKRSRRSRSSGTPKTRSKSTPQTTTKKVTDSQKMPETINTESDNVVSTLRADNAGEMTNSERKMRDKISVHNVGTIKEQKQAKLSTSLKRPQKVNSSSSSTCNNKKKRDINEEKVLKDGQCSNNVREDLSCTLEEIHFPKPSSDLSRPGGPFTAVDFCLPDKDFVKLKLAKIKETQAKKIKKMDSGGTTTKQESSNLKAKATGNKDDHNTNKEGVKACLDLKHFTESPKESIKRLKTFQKQKQSRDVVGDLRKSDLSETMMHNSNSESCLSGSILDPLWVSRDVHSMCDMQNQPLRIETECCTKSSLHNDVDCTKDTNRNKEDSVQHDFYSKCPPQTNYLDKISTEPVSMEQSPCSSTTSSPSLLQGPKCNDCGTFSKGSNGYKVSQTEQSPCSSTTSSPSLLLGPKCNGCRTFSKGSSGKEKSQSDSGSDTKVVPSSQGSQSQSPNQSLLKGLINYILNSPKTDTAKIDLSTASTPVSHLHQQNQSRDVLSTDCNASKRNYDLSVTGGKEKLAFNEENPTGKDAAASDSASTNDSEGFIIDGYSTNDDFNGTDTNGCGLSCQASCPLQQSNVTNAGNKDHHNKVLTPAMNDIHPIPNSSLAQCVKNLNCSAVEQVSRSSTQSTHCSNDADTPFKEALPVNTHMSEFVNSPKTEIGPNQTVFKVEGSLPLCSNTEKLTSSNQDAVDSFPLCSLNTEEFCVESPRSVHLSVGNSPSTLHVSDAKPPRFQVADGMASSMLPVGEGNNTLSDGYNYPASLDDDLMPCHEEHGSLYNHSYGTPAREHSINISVPIETNSTPKDHAIDCQPMDGVILTPCGKGSSTSGVGYSVESQATEPSIGDTATPSGKANTPKCTSAAGLQSDEVENVVLRPVLMQACLQHENSECSTVQSISMSTYNVPGLASKKREVIAICLPQWIVVWIKNSGEEWTILKTWTLEFAHSEVFQKVGFLPSTSHLVIFAGGTFLSANGRIYGCSENTCYDFHLEYEDLDVEVSFNSLCVLSHKDALNDAVEQDMELVIAGTSTSGPIVSKWTLDSLCLNAKNHSALPLPNDSTITLLSTVEGSSYLLIGLTPNNLILWNHQSCCLLKVIPIQHLGLHGTDYLQAETQMGLLFLIIGQRTTQKNDGFPFYRYALNPKNNRFKCLSSLSSNSASKSSVQCCSGSGQFIALGQDNGSACLWNMGVPQTVVNFPVFQGAVESVSFHPTRPIVAFGGGPKGCVHIYSLS